jgi:deoxyribonuclease-1
MSTRRVPRPFPAARRAALLLPAVLFLACGSTSGTSEPVADLGTSLRDALSVPDPDSNYAPDRHDGFGDPPDAADAGPDAVGPGPDSDAETRDPDAAGPGPEADAGVSPPDPDAAEPPPPPPVSCAGYADLADQALVEVLHTDLHDTYRPVEVMPDQGGTPNRYTSARRRLFIDIAREARPDGTEGVECLYTGTFFPLAPGEEPTHDTVNTEHVRPRSTLDVDHDSLMYSHEQSDLNHLYPTLPGANSTRGSFPFGEPVSVTNSDWAPAFFGLDERGQQVFAPRPERKGDVARVMFYMTARWGLDLEDHEEAVLKQWDAEDPVDARERTRNDAVEAVQGNRNPFIDCPGLGAAVQDFAAFPPLDTNENLAAP